MNHINIINYLPEHQPYFEKLNKAWIEKELGQPDAKSARFFGGEKWTYNRIAGGKSAPPLFNFNATECQLVLFFDREDVVADSNYSGC